MPKLLEILKSNIVEYIRTGYDNVLETGYTTLSPSPQMDLIVAARSAATEMSVPLTANGCGEYRRDMRPECRCEAFVPKGASELEYRIVAPYPCKCGKLCVKDHAHQLFNDVMQADTHIYHAVEEQEAFFENDNNMVPKEFFSSMTLEEALSERWCEQWTKWMRCENHERHARGARCYSLQSRVYDDLVKNRFKKFPTEKFDGADIDNPWTVMALHLFDDQIGDFDHPGSISWWTELYTVRRAIGLKSDYGYQRVLKDGLIWRSGASFHKFRLESSTFEWLDDPIWMFAGKGHCEECYDFYQASIELACLAQVKDWNWSLNPWVEQLKFPIEVSFSIPIRIQKLVGKCRARRVYRPEYSFDAIFTFIKGALKSVLSVPVGFLKEHWKLALSALASGWTAVKFQDKLPQCVREWVDHAKGKFDSIWNWVGSFATGAFAMIQPTWSWLKEKIMTLVIKTYLDKAYGWIKENPMKVILAVTGIIYLWTSNLFGFKEKLVIAPFLPFSCRETREIVERSTTAMVNVPKKVAEKACTVLSIIVGYVKHLFGPKNLDRNFVDSLWNVHRVIIAVGSTLSVGYLLMMMMPIAISNLIIRFFGTSSARATLEAKQWRVEVMTLKSMAGISKIFSNSLYQDAVERVWRQSMKIMNGDALPHQVKMSLSLPMQTITNLYDKVKQASGMGKMKPKPCMIHVAGPPGVGKNTAVPKIIEAMGYDFSKDAWIMNNASAYWDGYHGQQHIIPDEWMMGPAQINEIRAAELIACMGGTPYFPQFASIDSYHTGRKGDPCLAKFFWTMNNSLNTVWKGQNQGAANRRYAFKIKMTPRADCGKWNAVDDNLVENGGNFVVGSFYEGLPPEEAFDEQERNRRQDELEEALRKERNMEHVHFELYTCLNNEPIFEADSLSDFLEEFLPRVDKWWKTQNPDFRMVEDSSSFESEYQDAILRTLGMKAGPTSLWEVITCCAGGVKNWFANFIGTEARKRSPESLLMQDVPDGSGQAPPGKGEWFTDRIDLELYKAPLKWKVEVGGEPAWLVVCEDRKTGEPAKFFWKFREANQLVILNNASERIRRSWRPEQWSQEESDESGVLEATSTSFIPKFLRKARSSNGPEISTLVGCARCRKVNTKGTFCCDTPKIKSLMPVCRKCGEGPFVHGTTRCTHCQEKLSHNKSDLEVLKRLLPEAPDYSDPTDVKDFYRKACAIMEDNELDIVYTGYGHKVYDLASGTESFCTLPWSEKKKLLSTTDHAFDLEAHADVCKVCSQKENKWLIGVVLKSVLAGLAILWCYRMIFQKDQTFDIEVHTEGQYMRKKSRSPEQQVWRPAATHFVQTQGAYPKVVRVCVEGINQYVLPLSNNLFICNAHLFGNVPDSVKRIPITIYDERFGHCSIRREQLMIWASEDIAMFRLTGRRIPACANVINKLRSFSDYPEGGTMVSTACDYSAGIELFPRSLLMDNRDNPHPFCCLELTSSRKVTPSFCWVSKTHVLESKKGECGMPLISTDVRDANCILGLHSASVYPVVEGEERRVVHTAIFRDYVDLFLEQESSFIVETEGLVDPEPIVTKLHVPSRTKLEKSHIHGMLSVQSTKQPAILHSGDPRSGGVDPYSNAAVRFSEINKEWAHGPTLEFLSAKFIKTYGKFFQEACQPLTFEEAVFGIPSELSSINLNSSPGFPMQLFALTKGKRTWVDWRAGKQFIDPEFREIVLRAAALYDEGVFLFEPVMISYLKDELVGAAKIEEVRTRLTFATDVVFYVVFRMRHGNFIKLFNSMWKEWEFAIGMNPVSQDMDVFIRKMEKSIEGVKAWFACDYKNFDSTWNATFQSYVYFIVAEMTGMTPEQHLAFRRHETGPKIVLNKLLYKAVHNHNSGSILTTIGNCIMNWLVFHYCFLRELENLPIQEAWQLVRAHVQVRFYGDDFFWLTDKPGVFRPLALAEQASLIGMKVTSDQKGQELDDVPRRLSEISFLGCEIREWDDVLIGALKKEILWNTVQWTRDKNRSLLQVCKMMKECAAPHGVAFFVQYQEEIDDALERAGYELDIDFTLEWLTTMKKLIGDTSGPSLDWHITFTEGDDGTDGINSLLVSYANEVEWPMAEWPLDSDLKTRFERQPRDEDLIRRRVITWTPLQAFGTELADWRLPTDLTGASLMAPANVINRTHHKHRFSMLVEISVAGNRSFRGKLRAVFYPLGDLEYSQGGGAAAMSDQSWRYQTNVACYAGKASVSQMVIPWDFYYDFGLFDLLATQRMVLGHLKIFVESPLANQDDQSLSVEVYACLVDHLHAVVRTEAGLIAGYAAKKGLKMLDKFLDKVEFDSFEKDEFGTMYVRNISLSKINGPRFFKPMQRNEKANYDYQPQKTDTSFNRSTGSFRLVSRTSLTVTTPAPGTIIFQENVNQWMGLIQPNGEISIMTSLTGTAQPGPFGATDFIPRLAWLSRFGVQYEIEVQKAFFSSVNLRFTMNYFRGIGGTTGAAYTINQMFSEDKIRLIFNIPFMALLPYLYPPVDCVSTMSPYWTSMGTFSVMMNSVFADQASVGGEILVYRRFVDFVCLDMNPCAPVSSGNPSYMVLGTDVQEAPKTKKKNFRVQTEADVDEGELQEVPVAAEKDAAIEFQAEEGQMLAPSFFSGRTNRFRAHIDDMMYVARMHHDISQTVEWCNAKSDLGGAQNNWLPVWTNRPFVTGWQMYAAWSGDLDYVVEIHDSEPYYVFVIPFMPTEQTLNNNQGTTHDHFPFPWPEKTLYMNSTMSRIVAADTQSKYDVVNTMNRWWDVQGGNWVGVPNCVAGSSFMLPLEEKTELTTSGTQQACIRVPWVTPFNYLPVLFDKDNKISPMTHLISVRPVKYNATVDLRGKVNVKQMAGDNFQFHRARYVEGQVSWIRTTAAVQGYLNAGNIVTNASGVAAPWFKATSAQYF